jgi:hypothetical protein
MPILMTSVVSSHPYEVDPDRPAEARAPAHDHWTDVVVRPRSVIVHDGRTYAEGELVRLPATEVPAFEEQGIVTRSSQPRAD